MFLKAIVAGDKFLLFMKLSKLLQFPSSEGCPKGGEG
jgi:hypothetical protein